MSRLQISDLSFCESELLLNSQVQGGASLASKIGQVLNLNNGDSIRSGVNWNDVIQPSPEVSLSAGPDYTITKSGDENTTQYIVSNKVGSIAASLGLARLDTGGKIVSGFSSRI